MLGLGCPCLGQKSVDLSVSPETPIVGQTVVFTAVGVPSAGETVRDYRFDLNGDGKFNGNGEGWAVSNVRQRSYSSPQTLTVTVQFRDTAKPPKPISAAKTLTIVAYANQAPLAAFSFAPANPLVGQPVTFTSTASDPDGTISEQLWDLNGDGVFDNGGGPTALRTFAAPGAYVVSLRATDGAGQTAFYSDTVLVTSPGTPVTALRLLTPFPVVRIAGNLTRRGARLRLVSISAPAGASVRLTCRGRGCPFRRRTAAIAAQGTGLRVRSLERSLRAGVQIRIYVTGAGAIGKYVRFIIRKNKQPLRLDRCLAASAPAPIACR